jgi:hypothetical protein
MLASPLGTAPGVEVRRALVVLFALALAAHGASLAGIYSLTASPEVTDCSSEIVLRVYGWFPDGCWRVVGTTFERYGDTFRFFVEAVDLSFPGGSCTAVIVPYSSTVTVGPLPQGRYHVVAQEVVSSWYYEGRAAAAPFEVVCDAPLAEPVHGLRLARLADGTGLRLTWQDAPGCPGYVVHEDGAPDGSFLDVSGTSATGVTGVDLEMPDATRYYLVSGTGRCAAR